MFLKSDQWQIFIEKFLFPKDRINFIVFWDIREKIWGLLSISLAKLLLFTFNYTPLTRMHSSRMHTVHNSGRWGGCLPRGLSARGCLPGGGLPGTSAQGGVCLGGVCPSACWNTIPPVNRMTDRRP